MENKINKTKATIICINNNENIFLIQDLKNQDVESKINDKIAKGVSNIKILIITYLKEYVKTKFNKDIVREVFIKPSKENTSIEPVSIQIVLLILKISSAKQIFSLNKSSPMPLIAKVILQKIFKNISVKKYEKLINIPKIIHLNINWEGFSVDLKVKCDNKYFNE